MNPEMNRRDMLRTTGLLAAAAGLASLPGSVAAAAVSRRLVVPAAPRRALRLAHLTDSHVQPERAAREGLVSCLRHVHAQLDKPELIVTGGDLIMDAFEQGGERTQLLWDMWQGVLKDECSIPIRHCLGNHDIWGWNKTKSKTTGLEPRYGKQWAMEVLGLERPYYARDIGPAGAGGWRLIVLDSVRSDGDSYTGGLDDEQFEWLGGELENASARRPVLIVSHIPIIAVCALTLDKEKGNKISPGLMFTDAGRVRDLFAKHPNVKLCLSGHIHQIDRIEFQGVTYICDGAVSGAWWKGAHKQCHEGYGVVDLFDDGNFKHEYVTYGWNAKPD